METSEGEEEKRKQMERESKKQKKGLTEKELDQLVDIELSETNTFTMMFIPGILVSHDSEEHNVVTLENKKYEELKANKLGSDSYTDRGSQTMNLAQKNREVSFKGFTYDNKEL